MMKKTILFIILITITVSSALISLKNKKKIEIVKKVLTDENKIHVQKKNYLERCLAYSSHLNKNNIPAINVKFVIYYPENACFSCLEDLMKFIKKEDVIDDLYILTDDPSKEEAIISLNDAYNTSYKFKVISKSLLENFELNDILVLHIINNQIQVLEYKPEEKHIFKEYLQTYVLDEN